MATANTDEWLPPIVNNAQGKPRKVGFELEFSGITHAEATKAVAQWAQQSAHYDSLVQALVPHPSLGKFEIEVDWRYLKETAHEQQITEGSDSWVKLLRQAAQLVVPVEVVAPPIPITELAQLEGLAEMLRRAGAQGTSDSPIAAYGVHINPEVPAMSPEAITPYIQAFALLQWWLVEQHKVDMTRRISPYIDPYPDAYLERVLSYRVAPSMEHLIDDYFEYNPTRNRALDLWPLFAEYAPEKVGALMHEPLIKARPTFHYRLPNCSIDRPDWCLQDEWRPWLTLEKLAANPAALRELIELFFSVKRPWLGVHKQQWVERVGQWLRSQ